jgi:hypothetical protein
MSKEGLTLSKCCAKLRQKHGDNETQVCVLARSLSTRYQDPKPVLARSKTASKSRQLAVSIYWEQKEGKLWKGVVKRALWVYIDIHSTYVRERVNHIRRMVLLCATQQGGQPTTWDPVISPTHFFRGTPSSYGLGPLQFAHINGVFHRV